MKTISTPRGKVTLLDPPDELLQTVRSFLPFGLVKCDAAERGADYGIVMYCGECELFGVRQRPADCHPKHSRIAEEANNLLIAHSLATYLKPGFSGLFLPCVCLRQKKQSLMECGIAYFGYPSPLGRECLEFPYETSFDVQFGYGFTTMMTGFMRALHQSSVETGIPLPPPAGLDVCYRRRLGYLNLGFMLVGPRVVCLQKTIEPEADRTWAVLRATGISTVFHLPSVPVGIEEAQLPLAKPKGDMGVNVLPHPGPRLTETENRPPSP